MARIESLNVLLDETGKMLLAEAYDGVIENVQKMTISGRIKNTDLSGDPDAGTVEAKRFANASSKAYGTARTAGKGQAVKGDTVTIPIDTDREFVEEIEQKDISLLGVDGLVAKRSANHALRFAAELDEAFFKECVSAGTQFTPSASATSVSEILEEAIVTLETLKNDYIDGIPRDLLSIQTSPQFYSKIRIYLDEKVNNSNVNTAAGDFQTYHGVPIESSTRLPNGVSFIVQLNGSVAQPVKSTPYSAEKIPLSEAYAIELFFYYGTHSVTPETILYYAPDGVLTVKSEAGATSGKTKLTVAPAKASGNSYSYKTAETVDIPQIGKAVTGYTTWDGAEEITATTNNEIVVVELNTSNEVVRAGKTVVTSAT